MFGLTPLSRGEQCWRSILHISVRRLNPHSFDNAKNIDRNPVTLKPDKLRITIPVPVQNRALKRHRNPKNIAKELDKQKMRSKALIIAAKNPELNHRKSETYGKFDKLPLVSGGWHHTKSIGDYFTINPFLPQPATNFDSKLAKPPTFEDYQLDTRLIQALAKCGFTKSTNIQHEAIPKMLEYPDSSTLIAAETGNGKTLAFLVPLLQRVLQQKDVEERPQLNSPYGLIVTPDRELADQIGAVADILCSFLGLKVRVHKGGQIRKQIMNGPRDQVDIIVGSQGALDKLFHEEYLKRDRVSMIALDEIDTLLDDTFKVKFCQALNDINNSLCSGPTSEFSEEIWPTRTERRNRCHYSHGWGNLSHQLRQLFVRYRLYLPLLTHLLQRRHTRC